MEENKKSSFKFFDGKTEKLQNLCNSITDCDHSTPEWTETGKIIVRNFNIKNGRLLLDKLFFTNEETFIKRTSRSKPESGDLIITREAPMGEVCIIPEGLECCLGQRVVLIKPDSEKVDSVYLLYAIQSEFVQKQIKQSEKTGSIVSNLRIPDLKDILIPVTKHQYKIAAVLSSLDSKIELNNKINAELEAMAKMLYDYWFVQFDFSDKDGKPYKTSGGKMVWNDALKREIPDGWEVGTLADISELIRGVSYNASDIKDISDKDVVPILRATNITGNIIDLESMVYVNSQNISSNQFLNKYDILITMSSGSIEHIGKNGFYYFNKSVSYGAFCAKLVAKKGYHFYLYSYTQSDFMSKTIKNECLGTNINNLNSKLINDFKILLPPNDLVAELNIKAFPTHEKIGNNLIENQTLSNLRDWLLPMLMNGQVTVN